MKEKKEHWCTNILKVAAHIALYTIGKLCVAFGTAIYGLSGPC